MWEVFAGRAGGGGGYYSMELVNLWQPGEAQPFRSSIEGACCETLCVFLMFSFSNIIFVPVFLMPCLSFCFIIFFYFIFCF